jgi:hypothetical protein
VAGLAAIGIAASPEPVCGSTLGTAWTVLGAVTITVWPAHPCLAAAAAGSRNHQNQVTVGSP